MARVPIYAELTKDVGKLSEVVNKFQKSFMCKMEQLVTQLKTTKRRMEEACLHLYTQAVLVELAQV